MAESKISRDRELLADKEGVKASDNIPFSFALVKVHAFAPLWEDLQNIMIETLQKNKMFTNVSRTFSDAITKNSDPKSLEGLSDVSLFHPTDSHPPLSIRLESIEKSIKDVESDILSFSEVDSIEFVNQHERLETEISEAYQAMMVRQLGIELEA
jgi:Zn-dependent protease with chaperone function